MRFIGGRIGIFAVAPAALAVSIRVAPGAEKFGRGVTFCPPVDAPAVCVGLPQLGVDEALREAAGTASSELPYHGGGDVAISEVRATPAQRTAV
jgi:hypothetical protein